MEGHFIKENVIDSGLLNELNLEISRELHSFLKKNNYIGGLTSGHLNAYIGKRNVDKVYKELSKTNLFQEIETFFKVDLDDYHLTVGCNVNLPNSVNQHIHRDTNFEDNKILINIPCIDVNEVNGSLEVYPGTNTYPYSYLEFLIKRFTPVRLNSSCGDVIVRDSNLFHRGMKNNSSSARSMLCYTFTKKELINFSETDLELTNKIEFFENWYQTSPLGKFKEFIFIYIPFIRDLKRIIFSLLKKRGTST